MLATMRAARMHGYQQPLKLEEIPIPDIEPGQVLVTVGGAGKFKDSVTQVNFEDVNDHIDALARGDFVGRAFIVYE